MEPAYMHSVFCCPSVPEERNRNPAGKENAGWETHLWFEDSIVRLRHPHNSLVGNLRYYAQTTNKADTKSNVSKSTDVWLPVVGRSKDLSDCSEK